MKERAVAIAPRYCKYTRDLGLDIKAIVHDEFLFHGPTDVIEWPDVVRTIAKVLEKPSFEFRVPMMVGVGSSRKTWAEASGDEGAWDRSRWLQAE